MHRFFLLPEECRADPLTLPEGESHHAVHVLRVRERERVVVLNGAGDEILCELQSVNRRGVTLKVVQRIAIPPLPFQVTLIQALTRGKTMDLIVQKATELGAHRIVPILSERSVARVDSDHADHKIDQWKATAIEAIKQCGSAWLPRIETPVAPAAFLARGEKFDLALVASLQDGARHPREHFHSFLTERNRRPDTIGVWVGPEGDFTPAEMNAILGGGALPITLGQLVLRSETAAIYCLSVINYELQSPQGTGVSRDTGGGSQGGTRPHRKAG
jgi:16S rRNA (uracil1498-N3)-methyltransferase